MICDVADIDELSQRIRVGGFDAAFDLNHDHVLDAADRDAWVFGQMSTTYGDEKLDGRFDSSDFVAVFQAGVYEHAIVGNATWATGDWDGDGDFSTADLVFAFQTGGYETGATSRQVVPEPSSLVHLFCLVGCLAIRAPATRTPEAFRSGKS